MEFVHPETGEVLATREDLLAAMTAVEDRMSPLFDLRYKLRTAYLELAEPAEQPAPRYRTPTQEKVARCPRCHGRLDAE
jgi:hypothetical protein